jgi:diguanylate cyclase (GGDEF)-like protein
VPMFSARKVMPVACLLWGMHAAVLLVFGTRGHGPLVSDLIQLALGLLTVMTVLGAAKRSDSFGRYFWWLTAFSFSILCTGQALAIVNEVALRSFSLQWVSNFLFTFWFIPFGVALFLDPDHELNGFDSLLILDLAQAAVCSVAAYLFFFYLPARENASSELVHTVWEPYFLVYGLVVAAFLLRSRLAHTEAARALFGRVGCFVLISALSDAAYYYGPGLHLKTGDWFDLVWSAVFLIPLWTASTWNRTGHAELPAAPVQSRAMVITQVFPLLYPLLILVMSAGIARERIELASIVVFACFACSSARLLVTQHRLLNVQRLLRHEASHDGLTGVRNRMGILGALRVELERSERHHGHVGIIMADADRFKLVNDSFGHDAGDTVLRKIAAEISGCLRPYDYVGRYGGEEFLIVVPGCSASETVQLAERIRVQVAGCVLSVSGSPLVVTVSMGVASGSSLEELEAMLQAADAALYTAKHHGRNRVEVKEIRTAVTAGAP